MIINQEILQMANDGGLERICDEYVNPNLYPISNMNVSVRIDIGDEIWRVISEEIHNIRMDRHLWCPAFNF